MLTSLNFSNLWRNLARYELLPTKLVTSWAIYKRQLFLLKRTGKLRPNADKQADQLVVSSPLAAVRTTFLKYGLLRSILNDNGGIATDSLAPTAASDPSVLALRHWNNWQAVTPASWATRDTDIHGAMLRLTHSASVPRSSVYAAESQLAIATNPRLRQQNTLSLLNASV